MVLYIILLDFFFPILGCLVITKSLEYQLISTVNSQAFIEVTESHTILPLPLFIRHFHPLHGRETLFPKFFPELTEFTGS